MMDLDELITTDIAEVQSDTQAEAVPPEAQSEVQVAVLSSAEAQIEAELQAQDAQASEEPEQKVYKIGKLLVPQDKAKHFLKHIIILILLASFRSFTTYVFTIPNGFAPGGLGGISSIIYNAVVTIAPDNKVLATIFDPGLTMFVMNIPFIIAASVVLNKKFAISTFCIVSIYSALMFTLGAVNFPQFDVSDMPEYKILAALAGGASAGFGLGIMLRHNMSMGGTDIIGKILHKRNPNTSAQRWILLCDCIVATCSGILSIIDPKRAITSMEPSQAVVAVLTPIFFSFVSLICGSLTTDVIQSGFQSSIVFNIITDKSEEISSAIGKKLHRGVTMSTAVGCYTKIEHKVLTCVVSKRQITSVKKIISEVDPLAFTYITKAHEVAGKGFHSAG